MAAVLGHVGSVAGRVGSAVGRAAAFITPIAVARAAKHTAPMLAKELNHWAKRSGIDYRVVTSISKARRKLARIREENMFYTPDELRYLYQRQMQARQQAPNPYQPMQMRPPPIRRTPRQTMAGAGKEEYPPMVGPPTRHQAERAAAFPGTVYRQHEGTPVTREMYEMMQLRATRNRGRQYGGSVPQPMPGPPAAPQNINPRDASIGEEGVHIPEFDIVESGEDPNLEIDEGEYFPPAAPPPPLPPIGPPEPSPYPYLSLPAPPSMPLPKLLAGATIQPAEAEAQLVAALSAPKPKKTRAEKEAAREARYALDPSYKPSDSTIQRLSESKSSREERLQKSLIEARRNFIPPEQLEGSNNFKDVLRGLGSSIPKSHFG